MKYLFTLIFILFITACNIGNQYPNNDTTNKNSINLPEKNSTKDIQVFFSQNRGSYKDGIDEKIIADINSSKTFIDIAMYEFTNREISNALIEAHNRGVEVRVVTDDKSYADKRFQFDELEDAGIVVKTDKNFSKGLMHDKFLIIDSKVAWSGSGNYNYNSFYRNYENFVRVTNSELIANYKSEFEEMQDESLQNGSYVSSRYELYFSPEDNFKERRLISLVSGAQKSIYIMAFALNDKQLKDTLIDAKNRGIDIHIIFDRDQTEGYQKEYTQYYTLKDAKIDTILAGDSIHKMHNKVIVIDSSIVLTGSYNFTLTANDKNCENALIIKNSEIAKKYLDDFKVVYSQQ